MEKAIEEKYQDLHQFISRYLELSPSDFESIKAFLQPKTYPKNAFAAEEGKISSEIIFVIKGALRTYMHTPNGDEITRWISYDNCFACAYLSFVSRTPSLEMIQAMETTEVFLLSHNNLQQLYNKHPIWNQFMRLVLEELFLATEQRVFLLTSENARERYESFIKAKPEFRNAPLKYVASILGITPVQLSRIRRKIANR